MQTNLAMANYNTILYYNLTTGTSYTYYVAVLFAEIDPHVNDSVSECLTSPSTVVNGSPLLRALDVYARVGLYNAYELTSPCPKVDERWIVARSVYVKGFHNEGLLRSEGFEWKQKKREAEEVGGGGGG